MPGALAKSRLLYDLASLQDGYFTAAQAKSVGYDTNSQHYHVTVGNWSREQRGIFRLANYPLPERPDLVLWYFWSFDRSGRPQGVYSHETALSIYELSDVNPAKIHMTVPRGFRRSKQIPEVLVLHVGQVGTEEVRLTKGVPVTSPIRTLIDVVAAGTLSRDLLRQAVREARQTGLVTAAELAEARSLHPELDALANEVSL